MKLPESQNAAQLLKEASVDAAKKRLREYMDDTFSEFLDVNVLTAKDVYEVIVECVTEQWSYYKSQAAINKEFLQLFQRAD
jgi:hypothetical protein